MKVTEANNNDDYKIPGLFDNTEALFHHALTILKADRSITSGNQEIEIIEYICGIDMLDELVIEDTFIDRESFDLVYGLIQKFRGYVEDDYPMIARLSRHLIEELDGHRRSRFDA